MRLLPLSRIQVLGSPLLAGAVAFTMPACGGAETKWIDTDGTSVVSAAICSGSPTMPPATLNLSSFYTQYMDANGIPVVASPNAKSAALTAACSIVVHMLSKRDDVRQAMTTIGAGGIHVAVLAQSEKLTDIPEYRDLDTAFPGTNWDALRGVGATADRPVASAGEENLLCLQSDPKQGESELVFTFGISMELGIEQIDSGFSRRIDSAFDAAMTAGLWANTYSTVGRAEYWGEAMQAWFSAYKITSPPDGVHNDVGTRAKLEAYDPTLAMLVGTYAPSDSWTPVCPAGP